MASDVKRSVRVAERVREEVALQVRQLRDPRLLHALVTRVEMSDDLQTARIFVRLELGDSPVARSGLLRGLSGAAGRLRREVTRAVGLRYAPELRFLYDDGQDAVERVEELLREIHHDDDERNRGS